MMRPAHLLGYLALATASSLVWVQGRDPAPGTLSGAHRNEPHLQGWDGCKQCHGDGDKPQAEACLACHPAIAKQVQDGVGLHAALEDETFQACGACHPEHHGDELALVTPFAFASAGIGDVDSYDHRHSDDPLHGAHIGIECEVCHQNANADALPSGGWRYLGVDPRCASCHGDPHEGKLSGCEACHGQVQPFVELENFQHHALFPLGGGHADLDCAACHLESGPTAIESVGQPGARLRVRTCTACHEAPHDAAFLARVESSAASSANPASCMLCHSATHETFGDADRDAAREQHHASGFELRAPHDDLACAACHEGSSTGKDSSYALRYPGRSPRDCESCHDDPHAGQFDTGPFAASSCLDCHVEDRFTPSRFSAEEHASTTFPLRGAHRAASCVECHPPHRSGDAAERVFNAAKSDCASCHVDPHRGQFDQPGLTASCESCHDERAFHPSAFDTTRHARTDFPLTGQHLRAACTDCHALQESASESGDRVFRGTAQSCAACHADPHRGQFREIGANDTDCARCHTTESFQRSTFSLEQHAGTAFPLTGAHVAVGCQHCHPGGEAGAMRRFQGAAKSCAACHTDVHEGVFDRAGVAQQFSGRNGCARCHTTQSFRTLSLETYDHGAWTGFELSGRHARASCEACHTVDETPHATRSLRRASPRCDSCHNDPHAEQFGSRGEVDCARCHEPSASSFTLRPTFDHAQDTVFTLEGKHATLACSACHDSRASAPGMSPVVRYRPLGTRCQDCHASDPSKRKR